MDNSLSNKHLVVMTLVYVPVWCLWPYIVCLDIPILFTSFIVLIVPPSMSWKSSIINLKYRVLLFLIKLSVASSNTINFSCPVPLESLFYDYLKNM